MSSLPPDPRDLPVSLRGRLDAVGRAEPPADLLDAVVTEAARTPQARTWWSIPRAAVSLGTAAVAVVAVVLAVFLAGVGRPGASGPVSDTAAKDGFVLELTVAQSSYASNAPIDAHATLTYTGSQPISRVWGGGTLVFFSLVDVDGSRDVPGGMREPCIQYPITPGEPQTFPFAKSGGYSPGDPNAHFIEAYLHDPQLRLPSGTWDLQAHALFNTGDTCSADPVVVSATVRITVGGPKPAPSSSAPARSSFPATASPVASPHLLAVGGWSERIIDRSSQGIQVMGWSPDGSKFAVIGGHDVSSSTVQVFDESGRLLRTFPGWIAAWIDDDHLVAGGGFDPPDANTPTWIRSASGSDDRQLDTGVATLVGPRANGSVAMVGTTDPTTPFGGEVFRVLHGDALGPDLPGYALGWSLDGTKLAYVADVTQFGKVARGHLRLLDVSTMQSRDLGLIAEEPGTALLNADGSRLVTCIAPTAETPVCHLAMIDTESGSVLTSSTLTPGSGLGLWASPDTVLLSNGQALYRWTLGSAPVATAWQPPANTSGIAGIGATGSGEVILLPEGPDQASHPVTDSIVDRELIIVSAGQYAPHLANYLEMSPAGHRALFVRASASGVDQLILATVPG